MKHFIYFKSKDSSAALQNAVPYLNDFTLQLWTWFTLADPDRIRNFNIDDILEEFPEWTEEDIMIGLQELKRKKYLQPIDIENELWGFYDLPLSLKGVLK